MTKTPNNSPFPFPPITRGIRLFRPDPPSDVHYSWAPNARAARRLAGLIFRAARNLPYLDVVAPNGKIIMRLMNPYF